MAFFALRDIVLYCNLEHSRKQEVWAALSLSAAYLLLLRVGLILARLRVSLARGTAMSLLGIFVFVAARWAASFRGLYAGELKVASRPRELFLRLGDIVASVARLNSANISRGAPRLIVHFMLTSYAWAILSVEPLRILYGFL